MAEAPNDGEEFAVVNRVVLFGGVQGSGVVADST
jgi:hypothetical protein